LVLGKANIKNLLLIPIKFSVGRISFYPKIFYWLTAFSFSFFVFYLLFKNLKSKIVLFYFFIFPIFLGFIISFFTPLLQYFRFIYLIPLMCLLLVNKSYKSNKIYMILAFGFFFWSFLYLFIPSFHREDWKSLSFYLKKNKIKEVYMIPSSSDPLIYYYPQIKINSLKNCYDRSIFLKTKKIYVIPYTANIHGVSYQSCFNDKKIFLEKKVFRELVLEIYKIN
jgi:signal transduction histidine kinase